MLDPRLKFDAGLHSYELGGKSIPSVTTILGQLSAQEYRFVKPDLMAESAYLGTAVHALIELDCKGQLDVDGLDPRLVSYLGKWHQFRAQSGFVPILSESKVFSERYGYAGTLDLFGTLNGEAALIDAKRCASVPRTAGPQTAGYEVALRECAPEIVAQAASGTSPGRIKRYALQLTPSESRGWTLVPFTDPNDIRVFLSALTLYNWSNK